MKFKKISKYILTSALVVFLCVLISGAIYAGTVSVKEADVLGLAAFNNPARYYDNEENEITDILNGKNAAYISIDELPPYTKNAFIAVEDKRFYKHGGIDAVRLAGAVKEDIKTGEFRQGGSTITQQLAKNAFLTGEKTIKRKIKELKLTEKLEETYSKDKILELYLNIICFGNNVYGIQNASKYYFGKNASDLTVAESALLAAVINSPTKYSPITNPDNAEKRKQLILKLMCEQGYITGYERDSASRELIHIVKNIDLNDFYFEAAAPELESIVLENGIVSLSGCKIYTYYNEYAMKALEKSMNAYGQDCKNLGLIIDNKTGGIKAIYGNSTANISLKRQPASLLKPLAVYAPALEKGAVSPATQILDEPVDFGGYKPQNFGGGNKGWMSVRQAVSESNNIAAVKILDKIGIDYAVAFAKKNGLTFSLEDKGLSIALGGLTEGMTLKELGQGYSTLANGGMFKQSRYIKKIVAPSGTVLYSDNNKRVAAMSDETAYLMLDIMKTTAKSGTASKLKGFDFDIAAKTGTAGAIKRKGNTDAYCVSVDSEATVAVWIGNKNEDVLDNNIRGSTYPAAINKLILERLYKKNKPANFRKPLNINEIAIDAHILKVNHRVVEASALTESKHRVREIFGTKCRPEKVYDLFDYGDFLIRR